MLLASEHPQTQIDTAAIFENEASFRKDALPSLSEFLRIPGILWASMDQGKDSKQESQTHRWHQCYRQLCGLCPPAVAPCEFCAGGSLITYHARLEDGKGDSPGSR